MLKPHKILYLVSYFNNAVVENTFPWEPTPLRKRAIREGAWARAPAQLAFFAFAGRGAHTGAPVFETV